jgi:hypothetical protein
MSNWSQFIALHPELIFAVKTDSVLAPVQAQLYSSGQLQQYVELVTQTSMQMNVVSADRNHPFCGHHQHRHAMMALTGACCQCAGFQAVKCYKPVNDPSQKPNTVWLPRKSVTLYGARLIIAKTRLQQHGTMACCSKTCMGCWTLKGTAACLRTCFNQVQKQLVLFLCTAA